MFAYAFFCSKRKPYLVLPLSLDLFVMGKIRLDIAALLFDGISHYMPGEREGGVIKKNLWYLYAEGKFISHFLLFSLPYLGGLSGRFRFFSFLSNLHGGGLAPASKLCCYSLFAYLSGGPPRMRLSTSEKQLSGRLGKEVGLGSLMSDGPKKRWEGRKMLGSLWTLDTLSSQKFMH